MSRLTITVNKGDYYSTGISRMTSAGVDKIIRASEKAVKQIIMAEDMMMIEQTTKKRFIPKEE